MPSNLLAELHYESFPNGLGTAINSLKTMLMDTMRVSERHEDFQDTHIFTIRFTVPPCAAKEFEDEWMKLESCVMDEEKRNDEFHLKKTKLDNLFYMSYGEWDSHDDLMDHLSADHFKDFTEFIDEMDIRWELQILKDVSRDVEDKQKGMRKADVERGRKRKEMAHVAIMYVLPPGEDKGFIDQWTDTAFKTIKEDGNRVYKLRKIATDNTKFYGYGTWDSMRDYMDHFHSQHLNDLVGYTNSKDIVWFLTPMEKVGRERE